MKAAILYNESMVTIVGKLFTTQLISYLFIALLPFQLGRHFWPASTLMMGLRVDYLSPTLYVTDVCSLVLIVLAIAQKKIPVKTFRPAFLLLSLSLIQLLWVPLALPHLVLGFRLSVIVAVAIVLIHVPLNRRVIGWLLFFQLLILGFLTIYQITNNSSLNGLAYWLGERRMTLSTPGIAKTQLGQITVLRPYATFSHPNVLAGYTVIVTLWFFNLRERRWLRLFAFSLGVLIISLSLSHAAWLSLVVALAMYLAAQYNIKMIQPWLLIGLAFMVLVAPILLLVSPVHASDITSRNMLSLMFLSAVNTRLFIGWGWWGELIQKSVHYSGGLVPALVQPIHNSLWLLASSLGIFPTLWFTKQLIRKRVLQRTPVCFSILAALAITAAFDHYWLTQVQTQYQLAFITGMIWGRWHEYV